MLFLSYFVSFSCFCAFVVTESNTEIPTDILLLENVEEKQGVEPISYGQDEWGYMAWSSLGQQCPITEFTKHIAIMVQVGLEVALPVSTIIALMKEGGCSLELLSGEKLYKKLLLLVKPCLSVAKNGDLVIQLITEQGKAPQLVVPHDRLATLPERISEMLSALSAEDAVTALASLWLSSDALDGVVPDAPCAELLTKLLQTSVKNRNAQVLLRKTDGAYGFRTLGSMQ